MSEPLKWEEPTKEEVEEIEQLKREFELLGYKTNVRLAEIRQRCKAPASWQISLAGTWIPPVGK